MKSEAQLRSRQDLHRDKDAFGRTTPKGNRADSVSPNEGCSGSPTDAGLVNDLTTSDNAPGAPFREDNKHLHNLPQQAPASSPVPCPSRLDGGRAEPARRFGSTNRQA